MIRTRLLLAAVLWALCLPSYAANVFISKIQGSIEIQRYKTTVWLRLERAPFSLNPGDQIRTNRRSRCEVTFEDGSKLEVGPKGSFTLEKAEAAESGIMLHLGRLRALIKKTVTQRKFQVQTPTAVCAVRGTDFDVLVRKSGATTVDLREGLLAVADMRGNEILLRDNQRIEVDRSRMGAPQSLTQATQSDKAATRAEARREVGLDMTKEEVQAAAAREIKLAEYQQGKALIDAFGLRVRLEEYVLRPTPNQFKLVVLNERENRFDYFYYLGTFNTTLPTDLSVALKQLRGCVDAQCQFYLTAFESGRSNTQDSIREVALGGHPVDINNNADNLDNKNFVFDSETNSFDDISGRSFYETIFDQFGFYVNGKLKYGWTGSDLQSQNDFIAATINDPITGAALAAALPNRACCTRTFPDGDKLHESILESYDDGTFVQFDHYIINDEGETATFADFSGNSSSGSANFKETMLKWNFEQVITASEFNGRKIDFVVEPKVLIESGIIP